VAKIAHSALALFAPRMGLRERWAPKDDFTRAQRALKRSTGRVSGDPRLKGRPSKRVALQRPL